MKKLFAIISFACIAFYISACNQPRTANERMTPDQSATDTELAAFINNIRAVDNHAHANTIDPGDKGSDALPLDGLGAIELPARLRPESPDWTAKPRFRGIKTVWKTPRGPSQVILARRVFAGPGTRDFPAALLEMF